MRTRLTLAALAVAAGAATLPVTSASACDPNRFPNFHTYCGWVAWRYQEIRDMSNVHLPDWPETGAPGCP